MWNIDLTFSNKNYGLQKNSLQKNIFFAVD